MPYENRQLPDLIFIDLKMNGINGLDLIRWIKRNPLFRGISIVVLSGSIDPDDHAQALENGAKAFYLKPQGTDELYALVQNVLRDSVDSFESK
jgi:CheY-like chemotaxis protein